MTIASTTRPFAAWISSSLCALLCACGGGDSDYEKKVAEADQLAAQIRQMLADTSCTHSAQCTAFGLTNSRAPCYYDYFPTALTNPAFAQAQTLAVQHSRLVWEAVSLLPSERQIVCAAVVWPPPATACRANQCIIP